MAGRMSARARPAMTLAQAEAIEDAWRPATRPDLAPDPARWGAEPYPLGPFCDLLHAAMTHLASQPLAYGVPVFCDLGAGPGTKVLLAEAAGCLAWGVELVPGLAQAARDLGADVRAGNAAHAGLAGADIVYVNQLYRDPQIETAVEEVIAGRMRPGAVLIAVNTPNPLGPAGWAVLPGTPGPGRGAWVKPATGQEPRP